MSNESKHTPFISPGKIIPEFTWSAILMGVILGIVFGASSLYLALKVGMTVSASIPVAVLAITLFKGLSKAFGLRRATILENNIVQTTGSAGESIAFGVAVTMPALLILGFDMELSRIMIVATLGGLLGVLMMIPLRHALIVKEHGNLAYPEGTACAEVLIVGEKGGTSAQTVFGGFFIGLFYKILNVGGKLWLDVSEKTISWFKGASLAAEVSPELLGVGYIIGPKVASIMLAGGVLSSWVLIPAIKLFGDGLTTPLYPASKLISQMSLHEIWRNYVLYIGAGAVTAGGIISLVQSMPTIWRGAVAGLKSVTGGSSKTGVQTLERTERDLSMVWVIGGIVLLIIAIVATPSLHMNLLGALLIIAFGFLFVTVSSRLTGSIGSSSNPISGMTVATLLLTSLIFLLLGWTGPMERVTALSVAAIVCVAASNGGTTSQDLKTGFLVGATPRYQQLGLLVGAFTSALVIGYTLNVLNDASTIYSKKNLPAVKMDVSKLTKKETVKGVDAKRDPAEYFVLHVSDSSRTPEVANVPAGKYLLNNAGEFAYVVDPGINGNLKTRDDGSSVQKYEAPKARLMSLIIDGILTQKLPWGLVLLGVMLAVMMELCGIPSLPFAVGVYLPLSSSMPVFLGGAVRWLVERLKSRRGAQGASSGSESALESETSPGILASSGLIAGGAIAGIGLALLSIAEGASAAFDLSSKFPAFASSHGAAIAMFGLLALYLVTVELKKKKN